MGVQRHFLTVLLSGVNGPYVCSWHAASALAPGIVYHYSFNYSAICPLVKSGRQMKKAIGALHLWTGCLHFY